MKDDQNSALPQGDRAVVNGAASVSAVPASVPSACRGNAMSLGAYFLEGKRVHRACEYPPAFRVFVNPPSAKSDGTVLLCSLCNDFDYTGFRREPYAQAIEARSAKTEGLGPKDESAVPTGCAPNQSERQSNG